MHRPLSAIVVTLNEGEQLLSTVEHFERSLPPDSEIIVVDDGSTDGSVDAVRGRPTVVVLPTPQLGVAGARNAGAAVARHDLLVFADAHIAMGPECWPPLIEELNDPAVAAVNPAFCDMRAPQDLGFGLYFQGWDLHSVWLHAAPAGPVPVPLLAWGCALMRRDVFTATGGFDEGMLRWGSIDNEMSVRLWLEGYELRVVPTVTVSHLFRKERPYPIAWAQAVHNTLRLAGVHFEAEHRALIIDALRERPSFAEAVGLMIDGDVPARRRALAPRRRHDSQWLVDRFLAMVPAASDQP
jgi:GT2 family glycosyltransferase